VEKFIDTPVKRYSSGMYVRLAFAVAAHLEPEVLIVDEVLAVGDQRFQKKCLGKMEEVGKDGRTVIFVSHNMNAINQLCEKCALLENGRLVEFGTTQSVISRYTNMAHEMQSGFVTFNSKTYREGSGEIVFDGIALNNAQEEQTSRFSMGDNLTLKISYHAVNPSRAAGLRMSIHIIASDGFHVANAVDADSKFYSTNAIDDNEMTVIFKDIRLYPDTYTIGIWMGPEDSSTTYDYVQNAISFDVVSDGKLTTRELPRHAGIFFFTPEWQSRKA
jgi:lipopolysaccharide transport system ATP-binding protein